MLMSDRELSPGVLVLLALGVVLVLVMAGCAHAPAPIIDMDAPNVFESCKSKCALTGKKAIAACENQDHFRCLCEADNT